MFCGNILSYICLLYNILLHNKIGGVKKDLTQNGKVWHMGLIKVSVAKISKLTDQVGKCQPVGSKYLRGERFGALKGSGFFMPLSKDILH